MGYSDFLEEVRPSVSRAQLIQEGQGEPRSLPSRRDDRKIRTNATYLDRGLVGDLINNGVKFDVKAARRVAAHDVAGQLGPHALLMASGSISCARCRAGQKAGRSGSAKAKHVMLDENNNTVTFADVAGCDEAKEEVKEVVDFS